MSEPNYGISQSQAAAAAATLLGYYPTIQASDPQIYAAGLVKLFMRYPAPLVQEAIDPVDGLPSQFKFIPNIFEVKSFLEPKHQKAIRDADIRERFSRPRLPEPPRDPVADKKISEGLKQLSDHLARGLSPGSI